MQSYHFHTIKQLHITLHFLGNTDQKALALLVSAIRQKFSSYPLIHCNITHIAHFPHQHSPLIAAYIDLSHPLLKLHQTLKNILHEVNLVNEERIYKPHITLGRFNKKNQKLIMPSMNFQEHFVADQFILYQSKPSSQGSVYLPLAVFKLAVQK